MINNLFYFLSTFLLKYIPLDLIPEFIGGIIFGLPGIIVSIYTVFKKLHKKRILEFLQKNDDINVNSRDISQFKKYLNKYTKPNFIPIQFYKELKKESITFEELWKNVIINKYNERKLLMITAIMLSPHHF